MQHNSTRGLGVPAKPFRIAQGALIIKTCIGLTDEELLEKIKENLYLQFFIGLEGFLYSALFEPIDDGVLSKTNPRIGSE